MLAARGLATTDVRNVGLDSAEDETIASHAKSNQMVVLTRDRDFGDIRNYPSGNKLALSSSTSRSISAPIKL